MRNDFISGSLQLQPGEGLYLGYCQLVIQHLLVIAHFVFERGDVVHEDRSKVRGAILKAGKGRLERELRLRDGSLPVERGQLVSSLRSQERLLDPIVYRLSR